MIPNKLCLLSSSVAILWLILLVGCQENKAVKIACDKILPPQTILEVQWGLMSPLTMPEWISANFDEDNDMSEGYVAYSSGNFFQVEWKDIQNRYLAMFKLNDQLTSIEMRYRSVKNEKLEITVDDWIRCAGDPTSYVGLLGLQENDFSLYYQEMGVVINASSLSTQGEEIVDSSIVVHTVRIVQPHLPLEEMVFDSLPANVQEMEDSGQIVTETMNRMAQWK